MWAFTIQYSCYYLANNCFFILCIPSDFNFGAYLMLIYSWGNITHTHQPHLFDWSFLKYSMPPRRKRINIVFSFCIFLWQIWETIKKKTKPILQRMMPQDSRRKNAQRKKDPRLSTQAHFLLIQRKWKSTGRVLHMCCRAGRREKKWKDLRELGRVWKGTCTAMGGKVTQHLPFSF